MSEKISKDKVVGFSYELKDDQGNTIEKSQQPMEYLHGNQNIIPGLEKEMEGLSVGDTKQVRVEPADAYGEYDEDLVFEVPRENFPQEMSIEPGMQFQTQTEEGPMVVTVREVTDKSVTVDGNHDMAGQTLHFDIRIESVRAATEQETTHGHVHHGGHDH